MSDHVRSCQIKSYSSFEVSKPSSSLPFRLGIQANIIKEYTLSTIDNPDETSYWAGYVTTFSICVSLLLSVSLVFLRRLAQRAGTDFLQIAGQDSMRVCQLLVTVGFILGISPAGHQSRLFLG
jgi:hypothetical protein